VELPALIPETTPPLVIVALAELLLVHVPPPVIWFRVVVLSTQTDGVPVIAAIVLLTVTCPVV
jgi:hypothetical protein